MNGKQAKRLRREAQVATAGLQHKVYERKNNHVVTERRTGIQHAVPGTVRLCNYDDKEHGPQCTRAVNQTMKRAYKRGVTA